MALPKSAAVTGKVELSGGWVEVRGLSIDEVRACMDTEGRTESDIAWIAAATDTPAEEVADWWKSALAGDIQRLLGAIMETSGMGEGARFRNRTGSDAGDDGAPDNGGPGPVLPGA
jgi:hypothetical protein